MNDDQDKLELKSQKMEYTTAMYKGSKIARLTSPFAAGFIWLTEEEPERVFSSLEEAQGCIDFYEEEYKKYEEEAYKEWGEEESRRLRKEEEYRAWVEGEEA